MGCGGSKPDGGESQREDRSSRRTEASLSPTQALESGKTLEELRLRHLIGSKSAETHQLGKTGFELRYAACSQRGYSPDDPYKPNSDRFLILPAFAGKQDQMLLGIFDGHGQEGDSAAEFVKKNLGPELQKMTTRDRFKFDFRRAYQQTFLSLDEQMHQNPDFDDSLSGCKAITVCFRGSDVLVANVGNSRAILGERRGNRVIAYALSVDQTPYRKDERERVKASGAQILTMAMANGEREINPDWDQNLDQDIDGAEQVPLVFGLNSRAPAYPFTRTLGDSMTSHLGLIAEPELLQKQLREQDQFIALASDGVWEFITSQAVAITVMEFTDPVDACKAIIATAYGHWLQFETYTDNITICVAYIDTLEGKAPRNPSAEESAEYDDSFQTRRSRASRLGSTGATGIKSGAAVVEKGEMRPVRQGPSSEKKMQLGITHAEDEIDEKEQGGVALDVVAKTDAEIARIQQALKGNFLFASLSDVQTKMIYDVMKRKRVKAGEAVIRQGDPGDEFYVLELGELVVSIEKDGNVFEVLRYRPNPTGANPCFGELALMYSKPRAATVKALTDGILWAIDRRSFRQILKTSSSKYMLRTLRTVEVFKSLTVGQLQRLTEILTEVTYKPGEYVITQGDVGDTFFIVVEGSAKVVKNISDGGTKDLGTIFQGQYFGERALLKDEPRAANVIAADEGEQDLRCMRISKADFDSVIGSLQKIIDEDTRFRYQLALVKQLRKNAAGLANATVEDFLFQGIMGVAQPAQYMLAKHRKKEYTIRVQSKAQVMRMGLKPRLRNEMKILTTLHGHKLFIPITLQTLEDDSYIYSVYPTRVACLLGTLIDESETGFDEPSTMFYAASIIVALEHLHSESPALGGIMYRNICPAGIGIDSNGYPQLLDMRFATTAEPPPRDYCGIAHYLAPEQVSGLGHGRAVDFWALGILLYEMVCKESPFLTGNPGKDSEIPVYGRIASHQPQHIFFPVNIDVSPRFAKLVNALLEPQPDQRLGNRKPFFVKELREHDWFEDFMWGELHRGSMNAPHHETCAAKVQEAIASHADIRQSDVRSLYLDDVYEGDHEEFNGISSTNPATEGSSKSQQKGIAHTVMAAARNKARARLFESQRKARKEKRGDDYEAGGNDSPSASFTLKHYSAPRLSISEGNESSSEMVTHPVDTNAASTPLAQSQRHRNNADAIIDEDAPMQRDKPQVSGTKLNLHGAGDQTPVGDFVRRLSDVASDVMTGFTARLDQMTPKIMTFVSNDEVPAPEQPKLATIHEA